ncbi:MAG: hypothetical protein H6502_01215 [Candidatus Woesearchaeota archaeon]|nr:MAG: hypothetical protein H6502_01215 [Candidatus Woesearchaeota archaeon]
MKLMTNIVGVLLLVALLSMPFSFAADAAFIKATFLGQDPDPVGPGDYVDLRWKIENYGGTSDDLTFKINLQYPFSLDAGESLEKNIGSLDGYQVAENGVIVKWRVRVASDAVEGTSNVNLNFWNTNDPESYSGETAERAVTIRSSDSGIDIREVIVEPKEAELGKTFDLTVNLVNRGSSFVNNVKISTHDESFIPINTANQKVISRMLAGESKSVTFKFFVDPSADVSVHPLPIYINYTDKFGTSYSINSIIGIPVNVIPLYLTNLETTEIFQAGQNGEVVVSISNIGKNDINFVVLELLDGEGYEVIGSTKNYLGNLESDDFETGQYNMYVEPTVQDNVPLNFMIYYSDSYDRSYNETFVINHRIYSKEEGMRLGLVAKPNYVGNIILLLIVVGIVFFVWKRRGKKKRH